MTNVTDTFNRANGSLGANWTDWSWSGASGCAIVSNAATNASASGTFGDYWSANAFTNDQTSTITLTVAETPAAWVGVTVRQSGTGADGYLAIAHTNGTFTLFRGAQAQTQIGQVGGTLSINDTFEITATGTTIAVLHNGSQVISVTDSTYTSGSPGLGFANQGGSVTPWTGGPVSATPAVPYLISQNTGFF